MLDTLLLALANMHAAVAYLDSVSAPAQIGAQLDIAIHQLSEHIGQIASEAPTPADPDTE